MNTTADILDRAADRMVGRWYQGHYHEHREGLARPGFTRVGQFLREHTDVPCCAEGALLYALDHINTMSTRVAVQDFLDIEDLVEWNDEEGRTEVEVIAAFRGAAGALRNGTLRERPDPWTTDGATL